uniref:Uncharacterized protein n=1 Tax=Arundo donax TaxID=35708 RepID=A0A0A9BWI4_ARUDO
MQPKVSSFGPAITDMRIFLASSSWSSLSRHGAFSIMSSSKMRCDRKKMTETPTLLCLGKVSRMQWKPVLCLRSKSSKARQPASIVCRVLREMVASNNVSCFRLGKWS